MSLYNSLSLFDSFKKICEDNPQEKIVFFQDNKSFFSFTYRDIYDQSSRIASLLRLNNIKSGDKVSVIMENNGFWPAAFFGIIRIGAISVPLNPYQEKDEICRLIKHSDSKLIITSAKNEQNVKELTRGLNIPISSVDSIDMSRKIPEPPEKEMFLNEKPGTDRIASIIYTSGTTASPKGALISHKNLLSNIDSLKKLDILKKTDCMICLLPFYHSFPFTVNMLLPLLSEVKISIPGNIDDESIFACLKQTGVTIIVGVPRLFSSFWEEINENINSLWFLKRFLLNLFPKLILKKLREKFGGRLRLMVNGGAKLSVEVSRLFHKWGIPVYEGYGLTESSPVLTFNLPSSFKPGSAGRPRKPGPTGYPRGRFPVALGLLW